MAPAAEGLEPYQRVERLLDTVAYYGQLLTNPDSTLRAIEPTVRQLESQAVSVDQLLSDTPVKHLLRQVLEEGLKPLLNLFMPIPQHLTLASVDEM